MCTLFGSGVCAQVKERLRIMALSQKKKEHLHCSMIGKYYYILGKVQAQRGLGLASMIRSIL